MTKEMTALIPKKEAEKFFALMPEMDEFYVKMYRSSIFTDALLFIIQIFFVAFTGYASFYLWGHQHIAPFPTFFAIYLGCWYGCIKTIFDLVGSINSQIKRHGHYKDAIKNITTYEKVKKEGKTLFINEGGELHGK